MDRAARAPRGAPDARPRWYPLAVAKAENVDVHAIRVSESPEVFVTVLDGKWLLKRTVASLRREDPEDGFNRIVNAKRAEEIAHTVIEEHHAFPNAIVLATKHKTFKYDPETAKLQIPGKTTFLVVDGQHRLWAQKFAPDDEARYPCVIHLNRTPAQMAELFLEINDKQRRVPSSLRWDLYRLVRGDIDMNKVMTSDIIWELTTRRDSPFQAVEAEYDDVKTDVKIDLTGEAKTKGQEDESAGTWIKQGSLAPEIKTMLDRVRGKHGDDAGSYVDLLVNFFAALRSLDTKGWRFGTSLYLEARVLRAMIRVLTDEAAAVDNLEELTTDVLIQKFKAIDAAGVKAELRSVQGSAGVADLYGKLRKQVKA
jgi:DGQHR domain-containing protein